MKKILFSGAFWSCLSGIFFFLNFAAYAQDELSEVNDKIVHHRSLGDHINTIFWLEKKLTFTEQLEAQDLFDTRLALARSKQAVGYPEAAQALYKHLLPETEAEDKAMLLNDLATSYSDTKDFEQAEKYYKQASDLILKISGKMSLPYSQSLTNLGLLELSRKNYVVAERYLKESLKIKGSFEEVPARSYAGTLNGLGMVYRAKKSYGAGLKYFSDAQKIIEDVYGEAHPDFSIVTANIAGLYHLMGRYDFAAKNYLRMLKAKEAEISVMIPGMSEREKLAYLRINHRYLDNFFSLCADMHEKGMSDKSILEVGCNLAIGIKGLILESLISVSSRMRDNAKFQEAYRELQKRKVSLAVMFNRGEGRTPKFAALQKETEELEKKLNEFLPEASNSGWSVPLSYDSKKLRENLKPGEAAVEVLRFRRMRNNDSYETTYAAYVIRPEKELPELIIFPEGGDLETKFAFSYEYNINEDIDGEEDPFSYKKFWKPLEKAVEGCRDIYISTDGVFRKISLETLYDTEKKEFLLNRYNFHYLNNLRNIGENQALSPGRPYAAILGVSEFTSTKFLNEDQRRYFREVFSDNISPLPGVRKEVEALESILKDAGMEVKNFFNENASESNLNTLTKPQILHIATHGYFLNSSDEGNPLLRSGLLLSADSTHDGMLTALEVSTGDLRGTELVVLSACETGGGKIVNGEGVYGLQRAFFLAGADKLVMSLWKVDDEATQKLMEYFYRFRVSEKKSVREAFTKARKALRKDFSDPYYWGAFVLIEN